MRKKENRVLLYVLCFVTGALACGCVIMGCVDAMPADGHLSVSQAQPASGAGEKYLVNGVRPQGRHKENVLPVTIRVQEDRSLRLVPRELLGFNHNWIWSERYVMNLEDNQISKDFLNTLAGLPLSLNRMSGTLSQKYHWKWTMGPMKERKEQQLAGHDTLAAKKLGPLEWIKSCLLLDPDARFSWTLNMKSESASDHADLAELFRGDGKNNFNGGINWARQRIDFGLTEPVDVMVWELGNELEWGQDWKEWPVSRYIKKCREIIAQIRSIDPDARFAAQASTGPWNKKHGKRGVDWRDYHRAILAELGNQIDYITFHAYYKGLQIDQRIQFLNTIRDDIQKITGSNRIQIYVSEHASFPTYPKNRSREWQENWYQTHSLSGCLDTTYFLLQMLSRPEIGAAAYHSFSGGPWGTYYRSKTTSRLYTTGIFDLFKLFYNTLGNEVVSCTVEGERKASRGKDRIFTATAMTSGDELRLILLNRDPEKARDVQFAFNKTYNLMQKNIFTADSMYSHNTESRQDIRVISQQVDATTPFDHIVVPPKSMLTLHLQPWNQL